MATILPKNLHMGRHEYFRVNANELVLKDPSVFDGRWNRSEKSIRERAESFLEANPVTGKLMGQLEPCRVRLLSGKGQSAVYALVSGWTRAYATILIGNDPELRARAGLAEGEIYSLKVIKSEANAEQAVVETIVENAQRKDTSPIDDAHSHDKLREIGYKDADIARIVGVSQGRISQLKPLLALEDRFKLLIHNGEMSVEAGLRLLDLPPIERDAIISGAEPEVTEENTSTATALEEESSSSPSTVGDAISPEVAKPETKTKPKKATSKKATKTKAAKSKEITNRVKKAQREKGIKVAPTPKEFRSFFTAVTSEDCNYGEDSEVIKRALGLVLQFHSGEINGDDFLDMFTQTISG